MKKHLVTMRCSAVKNRGSWHSRGCHLTHSTHPNIVANRAHPLMAMVISPPKERPRRGRKQRAEVINLAFKFTRSKSVWVYLIRLMIHVIHMASNFRRYQPDWASVGRACTWHVCGWAWGMWQVWVRLSSECGLAHCVAEGGVTAIRKCLCYEGVYLVTTNVWVLHAKWHPHKCQHLSVVLMLWLLGECMCEQCSTALFKLLHF